VELMASLRRQWILASVLLALTLAVAAAAYVKLPKTYQSVASVVFLAPKNVAKTYGGNPYLAFNSTLNQTADVVRYEVNDVQTASSLAAHGYSGTYLVADAVDTAGPVLDITVTGHNNTLVEHTLSGVTAEVSTKLQDLQTGLAPANKVTAVVITFAPQATTLSSKKLRPLSVIVGLMVILTIGIPLIVDAVQVKRREKREGNEQTGQRRIGQGSVPNQGIRVPIGPRGGQSVRQAARSGPPSEGKQLAHGRAADPDDAIGLRRK
jgi:hypothetical protein